MNKDRFYIAYGSNLNLAQMERRCPTAEVVGTAELTDWRLRFQGGAHSAVATIERERGFSVPVLVWRIQLRDELALDRYEGWPFLYRKETLRVTVNGKRVYAMVYIMNEAGHPYGALAEPNLHHHPSGRNDLQNRTGVKPTAPYYQPALRWAGFQRTHQKMRLLTNR